MTKLPEKWCIIRNKNNYKEVNAYFSKINNKTYTANGEYFEQRYTDYMHFPKVRDKVVFSYQRHDYTLITFEQFKKFIMKEEPFILPENWWVKVTEENKDILSTWLYGEIGKVDTNRLVGMVKWRHGVIEKGMNPLDLPRAYDGDYNFGNEITFEQFKKYVLKEQSNLPEKWYIRASKELETLLKEEGSFWNGNAVRHGYYKRERNDKGETWKFKDIYELDGYTEITVNQYRNMNKKIIGYKLKVEKYRQAALAITGLTSFGVTNGSDFESGSTAEKRLEDAQVLAKWFEPVYETAPKFPEINGHKGVINGDYIVYGCAELPIAWFKSPGSRGIKSFTTTNNVFISENDMTQIRKVLNYKT
jgi:hypothetical protein